jgi:hypothetical protein
LLGAFHIFIEAEQEAAILGPGGEFYLQTWTRLLGDLADWSTADVLAWAERSGMLAWLADPDDIVYNQTPQYWATPHLIPRALDDQLDPAERLELRARILDVLGHNEVPVDTDWRSFRPAVQELIKAYDR